MELMDHQKDAIVSLASGRILWGGVGSGKSATVLAYYMEKETPKDIFVITTAKKRDSLDWQREAARFGIGMDRDSTVAGIITIDSWNQIEKYIDIKDAFFIFDEQRLVGSGAWVKAFIKIAKKNNWIMLSATPGDSWIDYAPVFIANGFYKNKTEFIREHVLYEPFLHFPKIRGYLNEGKLAVLRDDILVEMPFQNNTTRHLNFMDVEYDQEAWKLLWKTRWNPYTDEPIVDAAELWRASRRLVNTDPSRLAEIKDLMKIHPRLIIFYNFNYELEILRSLREEISTFECNGFNSDPVPTGDRWLYLVQYIAGSEAWNCTTTNATILYSLTYSYKHFIQAQGRIDRLDTEYTDLYYYILVSNSLVDRQIRKALGQKRNFNEKKYLKIIEGI